MNDDQGSSVSGSSRRRFLKVSASGVALLGISKGCLWGCATAGLETGYSGTDNGVVYWFSNGSLLPNVPPVTLPYPLSVVDAHGLIH